MSRWSAASQEKHMIKHGWTTLTELIKKDSLIKPAKCLFSGTLGHFEFSSMWQVSSCWSEIVSIPDNLFMYLGYRWIKCWLNSFPEDYWWRQYIPTLKYVYLLKSSLFRGKRINLLWRSKFLTQYNVHVLKLPKMRKNCQTDDFLYHYHFVFYDQPVHCLHFQITFWKITVHHDRKLYNMI
jgi:hypothetical protein